jgi:hypothetical protein
MYKVRLINRDIGTSIGNMPYAVCGRSGKTYGRCFVDVDKGGPVYEMSLEDYELHKFDLIGNVARGQQWVPEFIEIHTADVIAAVRGEGKTAVVNSAHKKKRKLIERAKLAGVYKKGMTDEQIKDALGY